jgi:hypothetical protein
MYLRNNQGKFYYQSPQLSMWVSDKYDATKFTPEEARGTHFHKFNSNKDIEII